MLPLRILLLAFAPVPPSPSLFSLSLFASLGRGIDVAVRHITPAMLGARFAAAGYYVHGRAHQPFAGVPFQP